MTKDMLAFSCLVQKPIDEHDYAAMMNFKMDYADNLCIKYLDSAFLARIAIASIRVKRSLQTEDQDLPATKRAYIIRQLKRPEEVNLLRMVYGKQFVLISAYGSVANRKALLESRIEKTQSTQTARSKISADADKLIERDASEQHLFGGQQLRDTFHLAGC